MIYSHDPESAKHLRVSDCNRYGPTGCDVAVLSHVALRHTIAMFPMESCSNRYCIILQLMVADWSSFSLAS